jgi:hypothetical protein
MKNNTLIVLIIELVLVKNYGVEILETRCPMNELAGQQQLKAKIRERLLSLSSVSRIPTLRMEKNDSFGVGLKTKKPRIHYEFEVLILPRPP